jgi:hypothetical protein
VAILPSCADLIGTSCTCGIGASNTFCTDSPDTSVPCGVVIGRKDLEGIMARSPMLVVDDVARAKCRGATGHVAGCRMIRVVEVQLMLPRNRLLSSRIGIGAIGEA